MPIEYTLRIIIAETSLMYIVGNARLTNPVATFACDFSQFPTHPKSWTRSQARTPKDRSD